MARPNILIIFTDQHTHSALGCMGHPLVKTPNIDRLAATGTVFDNAFCVSTLCVPSRVSCFTGQYVHRTGAVGNGMECHIQPEEWSFLTTLKEAGYTIGLSGKNHAFSDGTLADIFDAREEYGHWGKTHGTLRDTDRAVRIWRSSEMRPGYGEGPIMEGLVDTPEPFPEQQCPSWRIAEDAVAFLDQAEGRPFCLHCSFPDPHFPNVVCEPYFSMYDPAACNLPAYPMDWESHFFKHFVQSQASGYDRYTREERQRILSIFYGQISAIDTALGQLFNALEARGLWDSTAIVFTADHGDFGGQYGLVGKTGGFHEPLVRIPLLMHLPDQTGGQRTPAQVSNIDIMPTLAEWVNLPLPDHVQGDSFLPVLQGTRTEHRQAVFCEVGAPQNPPPAMPHEDFGPYAARRRAAEGVFWFIDYTVNGRAAMSRRDGWKYAFYVGDCEELYDLETDPLECTNLAGRPEHAARQAELKNALLTWLLTEPLRPAHTQQ